jgi:putative nucleotidyltransferase with HDIG domain
MKKNKTSLRNQLLALISIIAFLPLFIYIWQLNKLKNEYQKSIESSFMNMKEINKSLLETGIYKLFTSISTDISQKIGNFFDTVENHLLDISQIDDFDDSVKGKILDLKLNNSKDIMRIAIKYFDKKITSFSKPEWLSTYKFNEIIKDERIANQLTSGELSRYVSDPYPSLQPPQQLLITMAIPMRSNENSMKSIIYAEISLRDISSKVGSIALQENNYSFGHNINFFVVDGQGRLVFYPLYPDQALQQKDMTNLYIVGQHLLSKRLHGTVTYWINNEPILGAYYLVKDLNWGVIISEPKINATQALYRVGEETEKALIQTEYMFSRLYQNVLVWICSIIIIAFILAIVFARHISNPLSKLIDASLQIADGDFTHRIQIKANNEISQLNDTFNFMAEQLQKRDEERKEFLFGMVKCLAKAIDSRDPYTGEHSTRVSDYARYIAEEFGLDQNQVEQVSMAALLHDVGKLKVKDSILQNKDAITDEEYEIMKNHPIWGSEIMAENKYLKDISPGIACHHESFNGKGYPKGLKDEEIHLFGRIIRVADTFDAITSTRPYQTANSDDYAINYILSEKGKEFDPEVVDAFILAYKKGKIVSFNKSKEFCKGSNIKKGEK